MAVDYWRERYLASIQGISDPVARTLRYDAELKAVERALRRGRNVGVVQVAEQEGPRRVGGRRRVRNWTAAAERLGWTAEWTRKLGWAGLVALRGGDASGEAPDAG